MIIKDIEEAVFDIEAYGLLDDTTIDYTQSPYKLKDIYQMWCVVVKDIATQEKYRFIGEKEIKEKFPQFIKRCKTIIAHNGINYDLFALKLYCGLDYTISPDTLCGEPVKFVDTLCWSKCLNPDRYKGHSLEEWGNRLGYHKIDWRAEAISLGLITSTDEKGAEFRQFHPNMVTYCDRDVDVTEKVYLTLLKEKADWPWDNALDLEQNVMDIITRQSHRGFNFNKTLAEKNIAELDSDMEKTRLIVEPVLPPKTPTQKIQKDYTPPNKQFKKDGSLNANLIKFITRHGGRVIDDEHVELLGKIREVPLPIEPLIDKIPSTMKDTTHIKGWLVSLGWEPTEWKERDLTVDSKKQKLSAEKRIATIERYVEQTLASPFCAHRCEHLRTTPANLLHDLLNRPDNRPIKAYTNPSFTYGQDKEMCKNLDKLKATFPYAEDIVKYLTYSHRRNSILGGGFDPDDDEEEFEKGYLANIRSDGRISTPADSCGTSTSRFKHKQVANIPRVTSIFGKQMRDMFIPAPDCVQIGYDFDSLEARIEAHYCYKYDNKEKEYCNALIAHKPNDIHTVTAKKISKMLNAVFIRDNAKSVKYGCTYGAQAAKVAKIIGSDNATGMLVFDAFWAAAAPLKKLSDNLKKYWESKTKKKFILGVDRRQVPTRSPHSITNSLFQSAGVICAKRAMVIHDKKLREAGLIIDFFREDWKNKSFCQQMIAYHDEAQLEVSKSQVQFKILKADNKKDAEVERNMLAESLGLNLAEVGHLEDGRYFTGYSLAGDLATQSVREAGEYYNLSVPLSAGYIIGNSWGSCH